MRRLVIVPARGGSKRLPGKNILELNGKPLIFHTLDAVIGQFEKVIFTSDDQARVSMVQNKYDTIVETHLRSQQLATDESKVIDTVMYYVDLYKDDDIDQVWLCLPTCPLRASTDVSMAQSLLGAEVDSVVSVTDYDFPPGLGLLEGAGGYLVGYDYRHPFAAGNSRSQDQPRVLRPNGAIYGSWYSSLQKYKNFYRGKVRGSYMPRERSVDIDTKIDFMLAEAILKDQLV
jgi:CMP-N,N'-diacetyllegionaminic acid synthase